ncbi:MAG: hypothetical protein ACQETB_05765 [Halobacteriota archaeon]
MSPRGPITSDDPTVIRSIAVTVEDIVTALEASRRTSREAVIRITPPFNGRMRGRIHMADGDTNYGDGPEPIHVDPETLVEDVPPYPEVDETADDLEPNASIASRHDRHVARIEAWRRAASGSLVDSVAIETPAGEHAIDVLHLGE